MGGGGGSQVLKRIPRIKFQRRRLYTEPSSNSARDGDSQHTSISTTDVRTAPMDTAVGGKASLQPKRTPVSDGEIDAILVLLIKILYLIKMLSKKSVGDNEKD